MRKNYEHPLALPVGTELVGDYVITKVLGAGGFGITYEANERSLDRTVAIKEYFPVDIVEREGWALVKSRSKTLDIKYARGLRRFIEEAKAITQFNHPNIVRVLRYFKTNNTAFMVLHYEEGVDMGNWRDSLRQPPGEQELERIITPLLDALALIHSNDFLHRDIAPDNIIIRKDGSPILIDFGSARSELTFNSKTVSALVKSGYSPFEQYAKNSKEQGPWTDIYSFGATLYQMVTGEAPPDSLSRLAVDEIIPAQKRARKHYSRDFLAAIDSALAIQIADRPQSIEEWRAMLFPARAKSAGETGNRPATKKPGLDLIRGLELGKGIGKGLGQGLGIGQKRGTGRGPAEQSARTRTRQQAGALLKKVGQTSVADLMAKAGLRPASPNRKAISLVERIKQPLMKLIPRKSGQGGKASEYPSARPPGLPGPDDGPPPRSLRSLLNELDHRYEKAGHENMADRAQDPATEKPKQGASDPVQAKTPAPAQQIKKRRVISTTKEALEKFHLPSFLSRRLIAGLLVLGLTVAGVNYFSTDLKTIAGKVDLPTSLPTPDLFSGRENRALIRTLDAHGGGVTVLRSGSNDGQIISTGADRLIKIWDIKDGSLLRAYTAHDQAITALDRRGNRLIQGDSIGNVALFDLVESAQITRFKGVEGPVLSLAFAGRDNDLVAGSGEGQLNYWEFRDGEYDLRELRGAPHEGNVIAILSHRRFFVTGGTDNTAKIWNRSRKRLIRTYRGHTAPVGALALSPKAYRLATGSLDDRIKIWSPKSRRIRRTIKAEQGGVLSLAFAPNGKWLASGGKEAVIKIWNARNGRLHRTLTGHDGAVRSLLFSPDGKRLISAGDDGTIRLWDWNSRPPAN